jgi:hypothetical protein
VIRHSGTSSSTQPGGRDSRRRISEYTLVTGAEHGAERNAMIHTCNTIVCQGCTAPCGFQDVLANISGGTCPYLRSHGRNELLYAHGRARYDPRHTPRSGNQSMTHARMPSERRLTVAGNLQASHPSASSAHVSLEARQRRRRTLPASLLSPLRQRSEWRTRSSSWSSPS